MIPHNPNKELPERELTDELWSIDVILKLSDGRYYSGYYSYRYQDWMIYNFAPRDVEELAGRSDIVAWYRIEE